MELSARLQAVADMVTEGYTVCDVGCDHGYVPIYLVRSGTSPRVIATDIRTGPLERAREHISGAGLEEYIDARLSDGVESVTFGEVQSLIIAGMGGRLSVRILTEGLSKVSGMRELILQPQSEIWLVRSFLREHGFSIVREDMVLEDGKFYPVIKACPGTADAADGKAGALSDGRRAAGPAVGTSERQEVFDRYGRFLLENRNAVLRRYLLWEQERQKEILHSLEAGGSESATEKREKRKQELFRAEKLRKQAFSYFEQAEEDVCGAMKS